MHEFPSIATQQIRCCEDWIDINIDIDMQWRRNVRLYGNIYCEIRWNGQRMQMRRADNEIFPNVNKTISAQFGHKMKQSESPVLGFFQHTVHAYSIFLLSELIVCDERRCACACVWVCVCDTFPKSRLLACYVRSPLQYTFFSFVCFDTGTGTGTGTGMHY